MKTQDRIEFIEYLRQCTDNQVRGVHEKEKAAGRDDYVEMTENEAARRGVYLGDLT